MRQSGTNANLSIILHVRREAKYMTLLNHAKINKPLNINLCEQISDQDNFGYKVCDLIALNKPLNSDWVTV